MFFSEASESWLSVHSNNAPDSDKCLHPSFEALARRHEIREVRTRVTTGARYCDQFGLWLSLVERLVRDQEAVGSNPTSPIIFVRNGAALRLLPHFFLM